MASTEQFVSAPSFSSRNLDFQRKSGKFSISQNRHLGRRETENIMDNCRNICESLEWWQHQYPPVDPIQSSHLPQTFAAK